MKIPALSALAALVLLSGCASHHTVTTYWNRPGGIRKEEGTAYYRTGNDGVRREIRDGKWTRWHRNTQKEWELTYKDGIPVGELRMWYPDGKLKYQARYDENGLFDGEVIFHAPDGSVKRQIMNHGTGVISSYYDDGTLKSEIPYRRGRMHGKARYFAPDGRLLREEQFVSGEKQE